MFKLRQFLHRAKFDTAKQSGMNLDKIHEEQALNMCELNDRNEITWNAGMNL